MEEDIAIIDTNTRNEKIKKFFKTNQKIFITAIIFIILITFVFFGYQGFQEKKKIEISNKYNSIIIAHTQDNDQDTLKLLEEIIEKGDNTYSPLALYYIIDNKLENSEKRVNDHFDKILKKTSLEKELKDLIIYKKALFNANSISENDLLNILNPIIKSNSIWKSQGLYLLAEYFYSKNEKAKAKQLFEEILILEDANIDIQIESEKRLKRDLSD